MLRSIDSRYIITAGRIAAVCLLTLSAQLVGCWSRGPGVSLFASDPYLNSYAVPPRIIISSPTTGETYYSLSDRLSLSGTIEDKAEITDIHWSNSRGGGGSVAGNPDWIIEGIPLERGGGTNIITITARDVNGYTSMRSLIVYCNHQGSQTATYYLSPLGSDAQDGRSVSSPWKTFLHASSNMRGGDELILLDGTYSDESGTGTMVDARTNRILIPPGSGPLQMTRISSLHPGKARITGDHWEEGTLVNNSYMRMQGVVIVHTPPRISKN